MIDRRNVIERHNPCYKEIKKQTPLSVGNGKFCFTSDFTGLQTFFDEYSALDDAFPLCTMAEWGWHSYPQDKNDTALLRLTPYDTNGRTVYYASDDSNQEELFKQIRINTHKFHLGKISFELPDKKLSIFDCKPVRQLLLLWDGLLFSEFIIDNEIVKTTTFIHPDEDTLYIKVTSPLLDKNKLRVNITFPYGSHKKTAADFTVPQKHTTRLCKSDNGCVVERKLDNTIYKVIINGYGFYIDSDERRHIVNINPQDEVISFSVRFTQENETLPPDSYENALIKCRAFWEQYWSSGGFIDFAGSKDPRAAELERRIILSQYLIAIQSRGKLPPAETGLTCNSWYGKFHMEMYFWHHAHFALWGRIKELKRTFEYYKEILPVAKKIAASQGFSGARWPKMCDPSGENTPSSVAVFLIWQQPHPIMLAELIWRAEKDVSFLHEYCEVIIETCEFMKSFVKLDGERYVLGPPYIPAQERHDPALVLNAAYELEYFRYGFRTADVLLTQIGCQKCYGDIADKLALPAVKGGVYLSHENCPDTFSRLPFYTDHPSMLAMYGVLNSDEKDKGIMSATLDKVLEVWKKETFYGWDFPMMAMTACRLGRYKEAVDLLLMDSPKNTWLENGHNKMTGDDALPLYLPGNGGLLLAVAMLAAGYGEKQGSSFPEGFTAEVEGILGYV
ncbi:MAG: hypothetical protein FWD22_01710 [Treponema sp.]|nr:hypothetical protein [Treponema sp.]